jgi:DNA-binding IclR family transcriptional regulator
MSSLDNALRILGCFSSERVVLGVTSVAEELDLPKSSVSRLMKAMAEAGLLEQPAGHRGYSPGVLAFRLGNLYQRQHNVPDLVERGVARLVDEFGLTGYIGVLDGTDIVLTGVRQGTYPVRLVLPKGMRIPAHVTAIGLAILAHYPADRVREMFPCEVRYSETGQINSPDEIGTLVADVRERGIAAIQGMTYRGFNAVGAAVGSVEEGQIIGFSLSYPQDVQTDDLVRRMRERMWETAAEIGGRNGDPFWLERTQRRDLPGAGSTDVRRLAG